jgi:hypothetical protein
MSGAPWNGRFYESDPRFWPITPAARRFADYPDWPAPEDLTAPGIRFVAAPKPRRRRGPRTEARPPGYDARIIGGEVPTRPQSWHDFLNALVWATFPLSKHAYHTRQAAALRASVEPGALTLPNARTRELDALALLDEGGVLVLQQSPTKFLDLAFGHALYEHLVVGGPRITASALVFTVEALPEREAAAELADRLLAERLGGPFGPEALARRTF